MGVKLEVRRHANKLTPALLREFLTLSEYPQDKPVSWTKRFGYRLERMGLAKRTLLSDKTVLTPHGIEVRDYLRNPRRFRALNP